MPTLKFELEVTDLEKANFLARFMTGAQVVHDTDDDGPVNTAAPTTDSRGLPWNADYHASSKATNADGSWRNKKGVNKEALAAWEKTITAQAAPTMTLPASIAGTTAPVVLPNPNFQLPGFAPPQAAPADIPVTMDDINAAFGKLQAMNAIAPDGSNLMPVYAAAQITGGDQLQTDETARKRLIGALRQAFPAAGI